MAKAVVKLLDLRGPYAKGSVLNEPFTEGIDKVPVLAASDLAGAFNGKLVGAKSDVLHKGLSSFIHLIARKLATGICVTQPFH
jgi:hypothetical protein